MLSTVNTGAYELRPDTTLRWSDSFCSRMVRGDAPQAAPDAMAIPTYAQAPIAQTLDIGSYVGVPLELPDGELFGTLCAIDPGTTPDFTNELPAIRMYARLLSTILARELETQQEARRAEQAEDEALTDPLTHLPNRRAWDAALSSEEERCRRYGSPAAVLSLDLDGLKEVNDAQGHRAGDDLLRRTAEVLMGSVRRHDTVARMGGDEFAVLLPECPAARATELADRVRQRLERAGLAASVGVASRPPDSGGGLQAAYELADERMYALKRERD